MSGRDPGWLEGYVPSADEWNGWWARKLDADTTIVGGPFLPLTGGTVVGTTTFSGAPAIHVSGAAGSYRTLRFDTAGVARFSIGLDNTTETGTANAGSNIAMTSFTDAGANLNTNLLTINRNSGRLTLNAPLALNASMNAGFAAGNTSGIWQQCAFTGTTSLGPLASFNQWAVNSDTMAYTGQGLFLHGITYNFGGTGYTGNRGGLLVVMTQTGPASGLSGNGGIVCAQMGGVINNTLGGVPGAAQGGIFGLNIYNKFTAGAANVIGSVGLEIDIESAAGSSYQYQTGIQIVATLAHKQPAGIRSAGYVLAGQTDTIGLDYGFFANSWGLQSGSTFLMADWAADNPAWTMARGIDLRAPTFTSDAIASAGFAVNPIGRVRVGTGYIDPISTGLSIHADGAVSTAGTLTGSVTTAYASDGNHYFAEDPYGGVWEMTFLSGSTTITAITQKSAGYVQGAPPANPITLTPRGGLKRFVPGAITANLTWDTTRNALSLQPSGGTTTVGGPLLLAADPTAPLGACTKQYAEGLMALSGVTKTDRSGVIALGGQAQQLMAANSARKGWSFQNKSTADMYFNDLGNTASASANNATYLPAGAYYEAEPGGASVAAVSVFCAVTGAQFVAKEW